MELYCGLDCNGTINTVCENQKYLCGLHPDCPAPAQYGLSENDEEYIITLLNDLRHNFAKEKQAANMHVLSYSNELALSAQCSTNRCRSEADNCRITPNYLSVGQVWYSGSKLHAKFDSIYQAINNTWFNESIIFQGSYEKYKFDYKTTSFSQLVWAKTRVVGCGRTKYASRVEIICNYAPSGNIEEEPVFISGPPCSQCESNETCNGKYSNLCGNISSDKSYFINPFSSLANRSRHCIIILNSIFILIY